MLMTILTATSCYYYKAPDHSYGYVVDQSDYTTPVHMAYRRSKINYKTSYSDDEDIPFILAYGFDIHNADSYHDDYYTSNFSQYEKIVFYYTNDPYGGILTYGGEPSFINSIYGEENSQYKHLEEYGYYFIEEYEGYEFFSENFIITHDHNLLEFAYEKETFVPRDILNALGLTNGVGIMAISYANNGGSDYGPYWAAGTHITIEFSEL